MATTEALVPLAEIGSAIEAIGGRTTIHVHDVPVEWFENASELRLNASQEGRMWLSAHVMLGGHRISAYSIDLPVKERPEQAPAEDEVAA